MIKPLPQWVVVVIEEQDNRIWETTVYGPYLEQEARQMATSLVGNTLRKGARRAFSNYHAVACKLAQLEWQTPSQLPS